jgi:DNA-directed RNA polymerase sigma subunit (sigma70/sigma32)
MDERLELIEKLKNAKVEYELTEEERAFKNRYEKELKALSLESKYEQYLPIVYKIAKGYVGKGELLQDIVQEGNLYVIENLDKLEATLQNSEGDFIKAVEDDIERVICEYLMLDVDTAMENRKILDKLNQLLEAVNSLKEQNAEYSIEDLSEFLDIEVDEIENLLRIAGELNE